MERFLKNLKEFLQGFEGEKSSKRLAFVTLLVNLILAFWLALIIFLIKEQYQLALDLLNSIKLATLAMGGLVASEIFKKKNDK